MSGGDGKARVKKNQKDGHGGERGPEREELGEFSLFTEGPVTSSWSRSQAQMPTNPQTLWIELHCLNQK